MRRPPVVNLKGLHSNHDRDDRRRTKISKYPLFGLCVQEVLNPYLKH